MKVDNPLTVEFVAQYPVEAARVLEQVSAEYVAALFTELAPDVASPLVTAMLPTFSAACLAKMNAMRVVKLLAGISASNAARIYRLLAPAKQEELSAHMSKKTSSSILRHLDYAALSAGNLMNSDVSMLPAGLTVAEAMRRIERLHTVVNCEVYIIDDAHRLLGVIELGSLLTSNPHLRLQNIMDRKTQPVSAHATTESLLSHPGWRKRRRLPVVERDNTLIGMLDYNKLRDSTGEVGAVSSRDPLDNLFSLAGLYWLSLTQLLDSVLNISGPGKGGRQ